MGRRMPFRKNSPTGSTVTSILDLREHPRTNQDLPGLCFIAESYQPFKETLNQVVNVHCIGSNADAVVN
jgi:hypothetical protein